MRTNIFVLTDDLNFFYRLNKELQHLKIKFKVLSIVNKIPNIPNSIVLSTSKEMIKFENVEGIKGKILSYVKEENFEQYIVRVLAVNKIGNKDFSELVFSIDPGTKHSGLVIFLDDFYLNSHTIFEKNNLIEKIRIYVNALQKNNPNQLKLVFKFGRGIIPITLKLIEQIFINFDKKWVKILLIDETRTSKRIIRDNDNKKIPKDEAAALIISLRDGIEINYDNYKIFLTDKKIKKLKSDEFHDKSLEYNDEINLKLIEIAENVLKGNLSLSKSMELLSREKIIF